MGASGRAGKRHSSRAQLDGALQDRCGNSALCPGLVALSPLSVYLQPRRPHGVVAPVLIHDPRVRTRPLPVKQDPGPTAERSKTLGTCNLPDSEPGRNKGHPPPRPRPRSFHIGVLAS